ncbi:hypothetical protein METBISCDRAFT_30304 [Metschnikowia bicuspidata]|uniref:arginyltransferase n=1 Tax=Metschnikowia bicuspidata TaxID=27322 RepID=A0A4P9ZED1_9ASCO|nr:hypothetical protein METBISCDRAFT_30304 [Metschnikowia bicuspidata]
MVQEPPFFITPFQYFCLGRCGYCSLDKEPRPLGGQKLPDAAEGELSPTHITIGAEVVVMSCKDYEKCMNMGYRRSGTFLYKGDMLRGCCRLYTIRTNLQHLKISKKHRQVVNRFKKAILSGPKTQLLSKSFDLKSLIEAEQRSMRFRTVYEPASFSEEKYQLYVKYQTRVHNDKPEDVPRRQFRRFLIETPLARDQTLGGEDWDILDSWVKNWKRDTPLPTNTRIGPTHECYYLDGKLVAISVMDFLPSSLSSVYFIWDPDYAHLSLGTLLSLREILLCNELKIPYYYLGYYVKDCSKMRYKAKFGGEILDVCNNVFVPLNKMDQLLEKDQLWTLGNLNEKGEAEIQKELFLYFKEEPPVYDGEVANAANAIYGHSRVYADAMDALNKIIEEFKCDGFDIPAVTPGLLPMPQILEDLRKRWKGFSVSIFLKHSVSKQLSDLDPISLSRVVDLIRLLGWDLVENRLLIVMPDLSE